MSAEKSSVNKDVKDKKGIDVFCGDCGWPLRSNRRAVAKGRWCCREKRLMGGAERHGCVANCCGYFANVLLASSLSRVTWINSSLAMEKKEIQSTSKAGPSIITAKFELKPPPYPLVWNHDFFWESMKPGGGGKPSGDLLELIDRDFGSFEGFVEEFRSAAATVFGSGWAWLAYKSNSPSGDDKKLEVVKSPNAVNPLVWDYYYPLLTIDVWEHAYYLDFQNRRVDYISIFMEKLVSWEAVSSRLETAKARAAEKPISKQ
ncbi:hypothetical protein F0562_031456 [Nyssa sinensis]|uniref:superoxide dismutase n=1 Tax=Nyssa sinensis TaxID=561372 RepID=A0A5J5AU76_9ASTE|nr:hypothetical protein F0562_031456 [Nyssa sinensis]